MRSDTVIKYLVCLVHDEYLPRPNIRPNKLASDDFKQPARRGGVQKRVGEVDDGELSCFEPFLQLRTRVLPQKRLEELEALLETNVLHGLESRFLHFLEERVVGIGILAQLPEDILPEQNNNEIHRGARDDWIDLLALTRIILM